MDEDIPSLPIGFPAKIEGSISGSYDVHHQKITLDSKVYPQCSNKIEEIGFLRKRKLHGVCDGQGKMNFKELMSPFEKIERLDKLRKKGLISDKEFNDKKKEILDKEI